MEGISSFAVIASISAYHVAMAKVKSLTEKVKTHPGAFDTVKQHLPVVQAGLRYIRHDYETKRGSDVSESAEENFFKAVQRCERNAKDLETIFKKLEEKSIQQQHVTRMWPGQARDVYVKILKKKKTSRVESLMLKICEEVIYMARNEIVGLRHYVDYVVQNNIEELKKIPPSHETAIHIALRQAKDFLDSRKPGLIRILQTNGDNIENTTNAGAADTRNLRNFHPGEDNHTHHDGFEKLPSQRLIRIVPYTRHRFFVGREAVIEEIQTKLLEHGHRRIVLFGVGGIGKTQTALEIAHRVMEEMPDYSVFWVSVDSMASFEMSCKDIMKKLQPGLGKDEDPKLCFQKYLSQVDTGRWLLVVDNADDTSVVMGSKGVCRYLPQQSTDGHILFTTRSQDVAESILSGRNIVKMTQMSNAESDKLLGHLLWDRKRHDQDSIRCLSNKLGNYPLAITHTAAYINGARMSVEDYLELMEKGSSSIPAIPHRQHAALLHSVGSPSELGATGTSTQEQVFDDTPKNNEKNTTGTWPSSDPVHPTSTRWPVEDRFQDSAVCMSDESGYSELVEELTALFNRIFSKFPDLGHIEMVSEALPDLLRRFALGLGSESHEDVYSEVMEFVHNDRKSITYQFKEFCAERIEAQRHAGVNLLLEDKIRHWNGGIPLVRPERPAPFSPSYTNEDTDKAIESSQWSRYHGILTSSEAYRNLIAEVRLHIALTAKPSETVALQNVSSEIRRILSDRAEMNVISSRKPLPKCNMKFKSKWNPRTFVDDQGYAVAPEEALERAMCYIQNSMHDTEAMTCGDYVSRTWPAMGQNFINVIKQAVRESKTSKSIVRLLDNTEILALIDDSGCLGLEVSGLPETIIDIGTAFSWITTALRSNCQEQLEFLEPVVDVQSSDGQLSCTAGFRRSNDPSHLIEGACWQNMLRNPTVVVGYPIGLPQQIQGLELSLNAIAALIETNRVTVFDNAIFLKGFCTMLVPTDYVEGVVSWHVLFNDDGSRIACTDSRLQQLQICDLQKHLSLVDIEKARHVVGWCKDARDYSGSKDAAYDIDNTDLKAPAGGFAFDRITISGGKYLTIGFSGVLGKKDKPVRMGTESNYTKQLQWIDRRFVLFYDVEDRRAWLIDGLSALLHLLRASLKHGKSWFTLFDEEKILEADPAIEGREAAKFVLQNEGNTGLKLYPNLDKVVVEISQKGDGAPEDPVTKIQRTYTQVSDRVEEIYNVLWQIVDHQENDRSADGVGAKVRLSPKERLEGFDFMDVASCEDTIRPKVTEIDAFRTGFGWVDCVREIQAVTLFGTGFGELLQPRKNANEVRSQHSTASRAATVCRQWERVPTGEDLLGVSIQVLDRIMDRKARGLRDRDGQTEQLMKGIYWHSPTTTFRQCSCNEATTPPCDRTQLLFPAKLRKTMKIRSPLLPLPSKGAIIFGHGINGSKTGSRNRNNRGATASDDQPREALGLPAQDNTDSGIGTSVGSVSRLSTNEPISHAQSETGTEAQEDTLELSQSSRPQSPEVENKKGVEAASMDLEPVIRRSTERSARESQSKPPEESDTHIDQPIQETAPPSLDEKDMNDGKGIAEKMSEGETVGRTPAMPTVVEAGTPGQKRNAAALLRVRVYEPVARLRDRAMGKIRRKTTR